MCQEGYQISSQAMQLHSAATETDHRNEGNVVSIQQPLAIQQDISKSFSSPWSKITMEYGDKPMMNCVLKENTDYIVSLCRVREFDDHVAAEVKDWMSCSVMSNALKVLSTTNLLEQAHDPRAVEFSTGFLILYHSPSTHHQRVLLRDSKTCNAEGTTTMDILIDGKEQSQTVC